MHLVLVVQLVVFRSEGQNSNVDIEAKQPEKD